jgi:hypothetical protein
VCAERTFIIETPKSIRELPKLQFLNNFLIKIAVLKAKSQKTARPVYWSLVREPTGLPNKSNEVLEKASILIT